jgi:hypothetical protein
MKLGDDLVTVSVKNRINLYKSAGEPVRRILRAILKTRNLLIHFLGDLSMKSTLATTRGFLSHFLSHSQTTTMKLIAAAHMHHASNQILRVLGGLRAGSESF